MTSTNLRVLGLFFGLIAALLVCVSCGGGKPSIVSQPVASLEPTVTKEAPATGSPETGVQLTVRAADFIEYPPTKPLCDKPMNRCDNPSQGWRVVGVFLDLEYGAGLRQDALSCNYAYGDVIQVSLDAPNGATYPLKGGNSRCGLYNTDAWIDLASGSRVRLYLEGLVPANLPTVDGSTITVQIGRGDYDRLSDVRFHTVIPLQRGVPFQQGPASSGAPFMGQDVPLREGLVYRGISSEDTALGPNDASIAIVSISPRNIDYVDLTYRVTNHLPYDLESPIIHMTLVDARGYPYYFRYAPVLSQDWCRAGPGLSHECTVSGQQFAGPDPDLGPPDLSNVLLILAPGPYVFRGSGQ